MPRVSEAHLNARRDQILEAAWRCFARNGFPGTSMQDIFTESGLSAGAVYRYFPSKLELVKATTEHVSQIADDAFDSVVRSEPIPPPDTCVRLVVDALGRIDQLQEADLTGVALHMWSEALREPAIGAAVEAVGINVRRRWAEVATRWQAAGYIAGDADPDDVARLFYGIMAGYIIQKCVIGDATPDQYVAGLSALLPADFSR
ncbi:TetR/AcrR family transcriptional regulator [Phytoactinopolyspora halophila]|nr:TetR/AcrR family transcriptional regulator [Phytoactinopolyspora halophila]